MANQEVVYRLRVEGDAESALRATAKAADAAAMAEERVAAAGRQVTAASAQVTAATKSTTAAINNLSETGSVNVSRLAMAFGPLGGVLSRMSPEAGAAASSIAGMTSAIQGATAAGLALETAVPVVAAVTAAVAAGVIVWQAYNAQQERAAERAKKGAEDAKTLADYVQRLDEAQYHLKSTVGTLSESEEKAHAKREIYAQLQKDIVGKTDEQASAMRGLAAKTLYAREQEIEYTRAQKESAEALAKKGEAAAASAKAVRDQAKAVGELVSAYQTLVTAQGARYTYGPGGGEIVQRGQLTPAQINQAASAGQDAAMLGGPLLSDEYIQSQLDAVDTVDQWNRAMQDATDAAAHFASTAGKVGQGLSGPQGVMSVVGSSGPWGALIAAILNMVVNLQKTGDEFTDFTVKVNESIANLPSTITDNLPRWIEDGTKASIAMLPKFVSTLITEFFDPKNWINAAEAFIKGFGDGLTEGFADWKAPSSSQSSGSFDLFGALGGGSSGTSGSSSKSPDLIVQASDWWADFTKTIDRETSQLGRSFA